MGSGETLGYGSYGGVRRKERLFDEGWNCRWIGGDGKEMAVEIVRSNGNWVSRRPCL